MSKTHKRFERVSLARYVAQDMGPVALRMRDVARRMDRLRKARARAYVAQVRALYALAEGL